MSKSKGIDSRGNQTIKFSGDGNKYELGVVNGSFVLYTNGEVTHNLGTIQTAGTTNATAIAVNAAAILLKADAASPVFTGITTMNLPIYADDAAALAGGLTAGQLYQVTTTGVVQVVLAS